MNKQNSGLGRGLDSLLPPLDPAAGQPAAEGQLQRVPVDLISPDPEQPRREFDPDRLRELADSIAQNGLVQPLLVSRQGDQQFQIIAGERRWRAALQAGLERVPVIELQLSETEARVFSLVENIQREDLNPLEEARAFRDLLENSGWNQQQLADSVGKSRSAIANRLRLLELPEPVQKALLAGQITAGHARALLGLELRQVKQLLQKLLDEALSVRQVERLANRFKQAASRPAKKTKKPPQPSYRELEVELEKALGASVEIKSSDRKSGHIRIHFSDPGEFELLQERLTSLQL